MLFLLADVCYGRYKCVIGSLWSFAGGSVVLYVVAFSLGYSPHLELDGHAWSCVVLAVMLAVFGIPAIVGALFFIALLYFFLMELDTYIVKEWFMKRVKL